MRMRPRLRAPIAAAALAALAFALPAQAAPLVHEHYSGTDSGTECGSFHRESTFGGVALIKDATPKTGGQFFSFQDNYQFRDVLSNPANGKWMVVRGNGLFKELHPVPLGGGVFTYQTHESGQPFVVEDMFGHVVLRDRGMIVVSYVFDSLNDGAPGGVFLEDPVLVSVSGPHPGLEETFDFCALATKLIG